MRNGQHNGDFSVHAISGNHVVTLAFDAKKQKTDGLLGFALHRTEFKPNGSVNEAYWLKGYKPFEEVVPDPQPNTYYSTYEHPVQSFLWADFSAKPGKKYKYKVVPVLGKPKLLEYGAPIEVEIRTERLFGDKHEIHFNRGVAASQAYAQKFGKPFSQLSEEKQAEARVWLSRGLKEAIETLLERAKDATWSVNAAIYELEDADVARWFKEAQDRGADVKIIYHCKKNATQTEQNEHTLRGAGFDPGNDGATFGRTKMGNLMHCKFIVLSKNGVPEMVWTGSTNLTPSGILGHSNVGHCIRDKAVAAKFLQYWDAMRADKPLSQMRADCMGLSADLDIDDLPTETTAIFSPRNDYAMLDFYAALMHKAKSMACITLPFNMDWRVLRILEEETEALRYILLNGSSGDTQIAEDFKDDRDVIVAPGSRIEESWAQFLKEMVTGLSGPSVPYIHNKFLLVDPLSDDPIVVTGSANFSQPSTNRNDENMVYIRGNKRVADIYLGEFFRMFDHFYFRYIASLLGDAEDTGKHRFLKSTSQQWIPAYFAPNGRKAKKRAAFSFGFA